MPSLHFGAPVFRAAGGGGGGGGEQLPHRQYVQFLSAWAYRVPSARFARAQLSLKMAAMSRQARSKDLGCSSLINPTAADGLHHRYVERSSFQVAVM